MTQQRSGHAPFLCPPGTKMLLEVAGLSGKLATGCVGYARGRFVVTHMPVVPENSREALHQMLYPDNGIIARFLLEGTVMGFSASIIRAIQIPFPLLFLTYPEKLETLDLRRHQRVPCCIPATADLGRQAVPGMIVDLSLTGCQFSAVPQAEQPLQPQVDEQICLHCKLFGQGEDARLPGMIKRVAMSERRLQLGLKFQDVSQETVQAIDSYLQNALLVLT